MKAVVILLTLLVSVNSFGQGYYGRFWRGKDKVKYPELRNYCDDRNSDCFVELVNRWLIPATPSYAAEKALMAYAPVLPPKKFESKFFDEVALILYSSEMVYRSLRGDKKNIEGASYGPIHSDIFKMGEKGTIGSSRSLVPRAYSDSVVFETYLEEVSYDIYGKQSDLVNAIGNFVIVEKGSFSSSEYQIKVEHYISKLKKYKKEMEMLGSYILVNKKYFMQFNFSKSKKGLEELSIMRKKVGFKDTWITPLKKLKSIQSSPLLYERISYGEAGSLVFKPGTKPGTVDHYRLHKK